MTSGTSLNLWLDKKVKEALKQKANALGFHGKGQYSRYITKVATEPIIFLDSNARILLEALKLNSGMGENGD